MEIKIKFEDLEELVSENGELSDKIDQLETDLKELREEINISDEVIGECQTMYAGLANHLRRTVRGRELLKQFEGRK